MKIEATEEKTPTGGTIYRVDLDDNPKTPRYAHGTYREMQALVRRMKSPCPRCKAHLTPAEVRSLHQSYCGSLPRPNARGKKRPGIGGRRKKENPCGSNTPTNAASSTDGGSR